MTTMIASQTVLPLDDLSDLDSLNAVLPELPLPIRKGLTVFSDALSSGQAVRVEPISTMLTTGQAAEILNVSRMTLIKLLDEGRIPFEQPSVHRLVRLSDVLAYKEHRSSRRATYLQESMNQADHDALLQADIDDYITALKKARRGSRA